ncbi:MAG: PAS domain-containing protein [Hyphomicrobiales bacterium]|nr:PAS domain-containing protein [Hyphomicrobiales bacterium]
MSPPDNTASGSEAAAPVWPLHPVAAGVDASLFSALDQGAAAAIWTLSDAIPLWWNEAGAALFELPRAETPPAVLAAISRAAGSDRPWLERWRMAIGRRPVIATLLIGRARLQGGREGLVVTATAVAPPIVPRGRALPPSVDASHVKPQESAAAPPQTESIAVEVTARPAGPPHASSGDSRMSPADTISHVSNRRLTWQTDAGGRLLAGPPGTSLSQALGCGAPMQPALLSELFASGGSDVEGAIASGRPVSAVPVTTIAAPDGSSLIGVLFGAPVLDEGRKVAGYRGFLVVSEKRPAKAQLSGAEPHPDTEPVSSEIPTTPEEERDAVVASEAASATGSAAEAVMGEVAPPPEAAIEEELPAEAVQAEESAQGTAAAASANADAVTLSRSQNLASAAGQIDAEATSISADAPLRSSNVIALRKPGADVPRLREQDAPALSPAERDAFADIAKALGAAWVKKDGRGEGGGAPEGARDRNATSDGKPTGAEREDAAVVKGGDKATPDEGITRKQGLADARVSDLAAIVDKIPVGIVVHRAGAAMAANRTLLDLLGHESFEAFEARGGINELFAEPNVKPGAGKRVAIRTRDGEVIEVDARCQAIKWEGEAATLLSLRRSLQGETQSLEASHRLELTTKDAEVEELRALLDGAADGIVTIDDLGRVLAMNASAEKLFGYGAGEIAGEALAVLVAPECHQALAALLEEARATPSSFATRERCEITGRERDGRRISLSMRLHAGMVMAGRSMVSSRRWHVVFRDLTAAKDSEAGLVEARVAAERMTAQKSEFLAKVSHEIRTPLNSIVGFADIIAEERFGPLENERYKEYVKDIRASGTHIISLVNDLLDLSKIESGRMELSFTPVNLNAEVSAAVALVQLDAARSRVLLRQSLAQGLPSIIADARSIKQIVLNLLSNAVKFTEPGGQVIVSTALTEKGEVIFRARDTGIGMSERELAEALEPFKQFATTLRPGGSGLGLSLTKALVKANQANLSIASQASEGTLVEVVFPRPRVLAA